MDRVPRDVFAIVVECLLPCERRAARRTCWAWRKWPTRPRCAGDSTTVPRRRPGPVLNVRFLKSPTRVAALFVRQASGLGVGVWWGSACRTVVLQRKSVHEHDDDPAEVAMWLRDLLVRLVPVCEFVVVWEEFTDRLQIDPLPRGVLFVVAETDDAPSAASGVSALALVELAQSALRTLAPWGRICCTKIPDGLLNRSRHLVSTHCSDVIDWEQLQQTEEHGQYACGDHAFWKSDAPVSPYCRSLEYSACGNNADMDAELLATAPMPAVARAWPALRELRVDCGRADLNELAECESAAGGRVGTCMRQLAMIVEHAPLLRRLFVLLLTNAELRLLCEAVGRRRFLGKVELFFGGTFDQLFSIVLGCVGRSARLAGRGQDQDPPLLGRRLVLGGLYLGGGPQQGVLRRLVRVFESNGPTVRATAAVLSWLIICPANHEATQSASSRQRKAAQLAMRVFVGLPQIDFRNVTRHCHCVEADEFRGSDDMA